MDDIIANVNIRLKRQVRLPVRPRSRRVNEMIASKFQWVKAIDLGGAAWEEGVK